MLHGRDAPCRLVMFDSEHRYVGDLPVFGTDNTPDHWAFNMCDQDNLGYGRAIGLRLMRSGGGVLRKPMQPGLYFLQAVLPQRLLGKFPDNPKHEKIEYMRSNFVELNLTEGVMGFEFIPFPPPANERFPLTAALIIPEKVKQLSKVEYIFELRNTAPKTIYVYDPHLRWTSSGTPAPAGEIIVRDAEDHVVGDLLNHGWAKNNAPGVGGWEPMPPGAIIQTRLRFHGGVLYRSGDLFSGVVSESATWNVQFRFFDRMLSPPPNERLLPLLRTGFSDEPLDPKFFQTWLREYPGKVVSHSATFRVELTR